MDDERRLANSNLFASWAGEDFESWQRAVGATVTHLSRGTGQVTGVTRDGGAISIHVQYGRSEYVHPLWEFRTELTSMTYPAGVTREELSEPVRARRLHHEEATRTALRDRRNVAGLA